MTLKDWLEYCREEFLPHWRREAARQECREVRARWEKALIPQQQLNDLVKHWTALYYHEQAERNQKAKAAEVEAIKAVKANTWKQ